MNRFTIPVSLFQSGVIKCKHLRLICYGLFLRFVLVKYSCALVARYFILGLATHYRES